jgi:hypothetical protein
MASKKNAKSGRKKHEKTLKRRKRQASEIRERNRRGAAQGFPEFQVVGDTFDESQPDNEFIDAIYAATKELRYDESQGFEKGHTLFYLYMASHGYEDTMRMIESDLEMNLGIPKGSDELQRKVEHDKNRMTALVNKALFDLVPREVKTKFLPHHMFKVKPFGKTFVLWVRKLSSARTDYGTVYYDSYRPEITIDGTAKIIAFSNHAIDSIRDRIGPAWKDDYYNATAVCNFCHFQKHVEETTLYGGSKALSFFARIEEEYAEVFETYVKTLLGEDALPKGLTTEYRIGYCPVAVNGDFVAAKTLLMPGHRKTPEFTALLKAKKQGQNVSRHFDLLESLTHETFSTDDGKSLLKCFHDNGVPQVRQRPMTDEEKKGPEIRNTYPLTKVRG